MSHLQLFITDAVEESVHDHVTALHGNTKLNPGLHTLASLQSFNIIVNYELAFQFARFAPSSLARIFFNGLSVVSDNYVEG